MGLLLAHKRCCCWWFRVGVGAVHEYMVHIHYVWFMVEKAPFRGYRAIDVRHMRTGHNHALPSNPGTQWVMVSAGIAQERVVMARSQMGNVDRMLRRPFAAPPTVPTSEHRRHPEHGYMGWDW